MAPGQPDPRRPVAPAPDAEDEYAVRETPPPRRPPEPEESLRWARKVVETADPLPEPPERPFVSGVFSFPFYLTTLPVWVLVSFGLTLAGLGVVLIIWLADQGLTLAVRCFIGPVCLVTLGAVSYASTCFLSALQTTAEGYDTVSEWYPADWREWLWSNRYTLAMFVLAALIAWPIKSATQSWLLAGVLVFLLYPILLLSALESGTPLQPYSAVVLRSLGQVWWAWVLFYLETAAMLGVWTGMVAWQFAFNPFVTMLIGMPVLGANVLIYARLLGRLVWCAEEQSHSSDREE
jgi:hypothetical protein